MKKKNSKKAKMFSKPIVGTAEFAKMACFLFTFNMEQKKARQKNLGGVQMQAYNVGKQFAWTFVKNSDTLQTPIKTFLHLFEKKCNLHYV